MISEWAKKAECWDTVCSRQFSDTAPWHPGNSVRPGSCTSYPFHQLSTADLHIDRIYQGKRHGNAGDDPLHQLLGVSNQGGFRILGSREHPRLVVLTTSMSDPEWPDDLDNETGGFTYYGDNKRPGRGLHETPRFGNSLLRDMFDAMHTQRREHVPPVLIFSSTGQYRDMIFKGLAVPGRVGIPTPDDLVAIWKITGGERFQNYQAKFTVLDVPRLSRQWLDALRTNGNLLEDAPYRLAEMADDGACPAAEGGSVTGDSHEGRTAPFRKRRLPA